MKKKPLNRGRAKVHQGIVIFSICIGLFSVAAYSADNATYNKAARASGDGKFDEAVVEWKNLFFSPKASSWQKDIAALKLGDIFLKGREGVPAQPIEGYLWLLRAAQSQDRIPVGKPNASSTWSGAYPAGTAISILMKTFDPDQGLVKNPAAEFAWMRMAFESLPLEWLKEVINEEAISGAQRLAQDHETRRQSGLFPSNPVESQFLEAKQKWLQTKPAFERPFGILFGYDYPHELDFHLGFSEFKAGVMHYRQVKVYERFGDGEHDPASSFSGYSVLATPKSAKVFQVSAELKFASLEECMSKQRGYVIEISEEAELRELASCNGSSCDWPGIEHRVWQINGPTDPLLDLEHPLRVDFAEEMVGTRVQAQCEKLVDGASGNITLLHLPTLELQRAEFVDEISDRDFDWINNTEAGIPHASLSPFGIRLVAPLAKSIPRLSTVSRSDWVDEGVPVNPPQKRSPFQAYKVKLSPLTETVLGVGAHAEFNSRDDCRVTMEATAKEIFQQHYRGSAAVFRNPRTKAPGVLTAFSHPREEYFKVSRFYVTLNKLSTEVGDFSHRDRSVVGVEVRCDQGNFTGWLSDKYGSKLAKNMWALTVSFDYPWGDHIVRQERCTLDPTDFGCNFRR